MKKNLFSLLAIIALFASQAGLGAYPQYGSRVHKEQGGDRLVVSSGASLDVESGGELDVESGGSLKLAGTAVTSTAAELNALDGITSTVSELNILDGVTSTASELNEVDESTQVIDGRMAVKVIRSTFDVAVDGGDPGAYDLGEDLPADALVYKAFFQIITQFADSGSGTVALHCATANDLFSAADITGSGAGTITTGVPTGNGVTGAFDVGSSACDITATVATDTQSAGKLVLWVFYVTTE